MEPLTIPAVRITHSRRPVLVHAPVFR